MVERRIKAAKFPATKSLDSFDFKTIPSLNKVLVMELARCEYTANRQNVIALGPSGTGKTHVALGLGLAACQKGLKVRSVADCLTDMHMLRMFSSSARFRRALQNERSFAVAAKGRLVR